MEEWRDIKGYEGFYKVSSYGRIKSLCRIVPVRNGAIIKRTVPEKIMQQGKVWTGYLRVELSKDGKHKKYPVHVLVAKAFIFNDDETVKTQVNHKDENKQNNHADNLEWCTPSYNMTYGSRARRCTETRRIHKVCKVGISQYLKNGTLVREYIDQDDASAKTGISREAILSCCRKRKHYNTAGGYIWRYTDESLTCIRSSYKRKNSPPTPSAMMS